MQEFTLTLLIFFFTVAIVLTRACSRFENLH